VLRIEGYTLRRVPDPAALSAAGTGTASSASTSGAATVQPLREIQSARVLLLEHGTKRCQHIHRRAGTFRPGLGERAHAVVPICRA